MDIWSEIRQRLDTLDILVNEAKKHGRDLADKERKYKTALANEMLNLRIDKGYPVTLIPDLARGNSQVARLRVERDAADALYRATLEAINVNKLRIRILEAEYDRIYRG